MVKRLLKAEGQKTRTGKQEERGVDWKSMGESIANRWEGRSQREKGQKHCRNLLFRLSRVPPSGNQRLRADLVNPVTD